METRSADRLDSLARWATRRAGIQPATRGRVEAEYSAATGVEPGFSRARVLRLGLAGAASLLVGGYRPARALAQDRNECLIGCYDRYAKAADRDLRACDSLYRNPKNVFNYRRGWVRFRAILDRGSLGFVNDAINEASWQVCRHRAVNQMEKGLERCDDACRETCPDSGRRTPSAVASSASVCRGTHPPPASKPTPPPPPNPANDPCWACVNVGGACCGSCPRDPKIAPCLTRLTTGGTAGDCNEALSQC